MPFWEDAFGAQGEMSAILIGDLHAGKVHLGVKAGSDFQACFGFGGADKLESLLVAVEGFGGPIPANRESLVIGQP